ncbi:MAG: ATP-binding cassette domain-containing protein [Holophagales bacterium]|jgi:ABC-2 type transport system ATP-binding protein|nr:ATP-binding cassette domain-containing protein [Holophagales bacterium]
MSDTMIHVEGLTKFYGKASVLKGVDFDVHKGSVFCLLGSNGAGKTTIIRILATLIKPNGGKAQVCGYDVVKEAGQVRRHISLTGQYAAVDELLTARENLIMTGQLFHMKDSKHRANELLAQFNLQNDGDKKVSAYSGGMRRRLDIAMSLAGNPEVIFLDEPTTGLDPQNRIEMWNIVKNLVASGTTIFLTTQYLEEAERLADTIAVLHEGKIVTQGTPDELKSRVHECRILFRFADVQQLQTAIERLSDCVTEADDNALTLSVRADGSVSAVATIISHLDGLDVIGMEQKSASLEDVFLKLIETEGK